MVEMKKKQNREEKLKALLRRKAERYLRMPGVTSVGVGYKIKKGKPTSELCIQYTVAKKLEPDQLKAENMELLPPTIRDDDGEEVTVDVLERIFKPSVTIISEPESASGRRKRRRRLNPIMPGISVSHHEGTAGTLGGIVYDGETGEPHILSNWHVLQGAGGKAGDKVLQPGPFDGGSTKRTFVGRLARSHLGLAGDCAVATIEGREIDPNIFELDVTPQRVGLVNLGDKVTKSGRTTEVTHGTVSRVGVVVKLNYGGTVGIREIGGFEIVPNPDFPPPRGEISMGGDSGSCWMMDEDGLRDVIVGLHFAGEIDPAPAAEHAIACNIHSVLEKLNVSFNPGVARESECAVLHRQIQRSEGGAPAEEDSEEDLLKPDQLDELERIFQEDPKGLLEKFRAALDEDLSENELENGLEEMRFAFESPRNASPALEAMSALETSSAALPAGFTFPGMDLDEIPINPGSRKFEPVGDWLRWLLYAGGSILEGPPKVKFRWAADHASRFEYPLEEPSREHPLEIALFSDFGTGLYHSRYIAKQLVEGRFPYAIHVGDVYYSGRKSEFRKYMTRPLSPLFGATELFLLNSNHEMYSGGKPYFRFLDDKRAAHSDRQKQEGSYFCLRSKRFQILGIDTAYHEDGWFRNPNLLEWLDEKLREGRSNGQTNILLSANHPYEYGKMEFSKLFRDDLGDLIGDRVDLWFWGNTHYCALFDRGPRIPFLGSCIGHGGFPYKRKKLGQRAPAPVRFLETATRFPQWTRLRPGRGNSGYCVLTLKADGSAGLKYIDWMRNQRCTAELTLQKPEGRLVISGTQVVSASSIR